MLEELTSPEARTPDPFAIVRATHLSQEEKRELLSFWLSDVHAVPDHPALRRIEDGTVLHVDELTAALRALDGTSRRGRRLRPRAFLENGWTEAPRPIGPGGRPPRGRRSALPPPPEFVDARTGLEARRLAG
jgi:hypothetical protein